MLGVVLQHKRGINLCSCLPMSRLLALTEQLNVIPEKMQLMGLLRKVATVQRFWLSISILTDGRGTTTSVAADALRAQHMEAEHNVFSGCGPMPGASCPRQSQMMQANSENAYLNAAVNYFRKTNFFIAKLSTA